MNYLSLLAMIENEEDYWIAMRRIDRLISLDPQEGTELFDELNLISTQIESYENVHYKIETSDFPKQRDSK